jgi:inosine-uridine nucleoside N-ribohydrolase
MLMIKPYASLLMLSLFALLSTGCKTFPKGEKNGVAQKARVLFDTDANNEVDDQHALAYLLFNGKAFQVEGITVNATYNGGTIDSHYREAERVIRLCGTEGRFPLVKGADKDFTTIKNAIHQTTFDGSEAVNLIIEKARTGNGQPLVIIAVGKLTNIALALTKDSTIASKVRVVWLGSNYPESGEYNQDNDTAALNYLLDSEVPFEMVTVRYGKPSGTDAVKVTKEEITKNMTGKGPRIAQAVVGRHGAAFTTFGDYSVNLFEHIELYGTPPARSLFDMAAVAVVKNPSWAKKRELPAPALVNNQWVERPANRRMITVWENFDRDKIMQDYFKTMKRYHLVTK